jgi:hypothetical protein
MRIFSISVERTVDLPTPKKGQEDTRPPFPRLPKIVAPSLESAARHAATLSFPDFRVTEVSEDYDSRRSSGVVILDN